MKDNIYIFGHKRPDTDSTCAAITLSYLKNKKGINTVPCILNDINLETKFVLDYFNIEKPMLLDNVKLQIKDVKYRRGCYINYEDSILQAFNYMIENNISSVPVVDNDNKFDGVFAMKDIARNYIAGDILRLNTSFENLIHGIGGEILLKFRDEINGRVVTPSYRSTTFIENVEIDENTILIVGDRHSIVEHAIEKNVQLLIITSGAEIKPEFIEKAKEKKINIITTEQPSFYVSSHIALTNYIKVLKYTHKLLCFKEDDNVTDLIDAINKTKFSYYPIIDDDNNCLGLLKTVDLNDKNPKNVIMVDHQEYSQSVDGIDEANILEIIDHHKIGNTTTHEPINFLNRPIGSTNTIIYQMYKDYDVEIPREMAGLMMAAIISDTLLLKSPTTTDIDKQVLENLSQLTGIDYNEFGIEMFKAGSSLKGKSLEEVIYMDYKNFEIDDKKVGIGQVNTMSAEDILNEKDKYIEYLNKNSKNNEYFITALFITDLLKDGSYVIFNDSAKETLSNAFDTDLEQGSFLSGCVSRKKQIIPKIMSVME